MYTITKVIDFCYGHRLLAYEGRCRHLHGHNGRLEISFAAEALDPRGMVLDFGEVKRVLKEWVDSELDHRMILCRADPLVPWLSARGEPCFLLEENPTAENIARAVFLRAKAEGWPLVSVRLWETPESSATYSEPPAPGAK